MIRQLIPQEVCLNCKKCCRFSQQDTLWSPYLLDEEVQELLDKDIPSACLSKERRIMPLANPQGDGFICPFLDSGENKCKIYELRPFECQLYPFLISIRTKKILLTVDLNCPYVKEKLNSSEFKSYVEYLTTFLNSPAQVKRLKDNPHILQAYGEVADLIELGSPHEAE